MRDFFVVAFCITSRIYLIFFLSHFDYAYISKTYEVHQRMLKPIYVTQSFLPPFDEYLTIFKEPWESVQLSNEGKNLILHGKIIFQMKNWSRIGCRLFDLLKMLH